jgi:hypothetical protein
MLGRHPCELLIDRRDARLEGADFVDDKRDGVAEQIRERDLGVLENARHAREHRAGAGGDRQALFAQQTSHNIDPRSPRGLPLRAHAVQRLERLLVDGLHGHGLYPTTSRRFKQRFGVCAIGLVAADVRPHVLSR